MQLSVFEIFTVVIRYLRNKLESEDRKMKFDWPDFINQGPKLLGLMG